jgi:predicted ribosomally synthesized peptide with SipW-like signal peptide
MTGVSEAPRTGRRRGAEYAAAALFRGGSGGGTWAAFSASKTCVCQARRHNWSALYDLPYLPECGFDIGFADQSWGIVGWY